MRRSRIGLVLGTAVAILAEPATVLAAPSNRPVTNLMTAVAVFAVSGLAAGVLAGGTLLFVGRRRRRSSTRAAPREVHGARLLDDRTLRRARVRIAAEPTLASLAGTTGDLEVARESRAPAPGASRPPVPNRSRRPRRPRVRT